MKSPAGRMARVSHVDDDLTKIPLNFLFINHRPVAIINNSINRSVLSFMFIIHIYIVYLIYNLLI